MSMRGITTLFACADIHGEKLNFEVAFNGVPSLHDLHVRIVEVFSAALYECGDPNPGGFEVASVVFHDRQSDAWVDLRTPAQLRDELQLYVFQPNHYDDMSKPLPRPLLPPSAIAPHHETLERSQTFVAQYRGPSGAPYAHDPPPSLSQAPYGHNSTARRDAMPGPDEARPPLSRAVVRRQTVEETTRLGRGAPPRQPPPNSLELSSSTSSILLDEDARPLPRRAGAGGAPGEAASRRSQASWSDTESVTTGTTRESAAAAREDALAVFKMLDEDEDGIITLKALREAMIYHRLDISRDAVADTFDYGDKRVTAVDFKGFGEAFPLSVRRLRYMLEREGLPPRPRGASVAAPPVSRPPPLSGGPVSPRGVSPVRRKEMSALAGNSNSGSIISPPPAVVAYEPVTTYAPPPLSIATLSSRPGAPSVSANELDARELQLLRELEEIRRCRRSLGVE